MSLWSHDASIERLLPRAKEGHTSDIQELLNLIHPFVVRYCRARIDSHVYPTAEDIAQETCMEVVRLLPVYEDHGRPFMAFVYDVAAYTISDARQFRPKNISGLSEDSSSSKEEAEGGYTGSYSGGESREFLLRALDLLNEEEKNIVIFRTIQGYSVQETAELVGRTADAVRAIQYSAVTVLREKLHNEWDHYEDFDFSEP